MYTDFLTGAMHGVCLRCVTFRAFIPK